ncbi:hypothetical protein EYF80_015765 [Liparis tanakae]|uniref:Uncharacterized protein n=1 Tax=Liparis tanakae TaxID=230148 RepID=A0A4Z2I960_9TELE|nr:hypothetical protein EYF80_015765 [Liparis tanakae]
METEGCLGSLEPESQEVIPLWEVHLKTVVYYKVIQKKLKRLEEMGVGAMALIDGCLSQSQLSSFVPTFGRPGRLESPDRSHVTSSGELTRLK